MPELSPQNRSARIVDKNGRMVEPFASFIREVEKLGVLNGSGTPEGVVDAEIDRLYKDNDGVTETIVYVKKLDNISGDTTKGWILV